MSLAFVFLSLTLVAAASAQCETTTDQQLKIKKGETFQQFCDGMDGNAKWLVFDATSASVNNDHYSLNSVVYEDTGGTRAKDSWCSGFEGAFSDNFDQQTCACSCLLPGFFDGWFWV